MSSRGLGDVYKRQYMNFIILFHKSNHVRHARVKGNDRADTLAVSSLHKWLAARKILSVEVLETAPAGAIRGTSPHR